MFRVALYTTVYPGVERYLSSWYESMLVQTDLDFDIWIGIDSLSVQKVVASMGGELDAHWISSNIASSPGQIRQAAIEQLVQRYEAVVFVDSDDMLLPTRVEAAKRALAKSDVNACALRVVDESGVDLGVVFGPKCGENALDFLPNRNVFGLSNTSYRTTVLQKCLPIPAECVLVDWLLATRAWAAGAIMDFDYTCQMCYRQHDRNTAPILPPFSGEQIVDATKRVLEHYVILLDSTPMLQGEQRTLVESARWRTREFYDSIHRDRGILADYVQALNQLPPTYLWWACVAHPELESVWRK